MTELRKKIMQTLGDTRPILEEILDQIEILKKESHEAYAELCSLNKRIADLEAKNAQKDGKKAQSDGAKTWIRKGKNGRLRVRDNA